MRKGDEAIVDLHLGAHVLTGLRTSAFLIMPIIVSGNANTATIMIGEMASDFILAD
jgi:choline dehydrogenase-like flavoprotein